MADHAQDLQPRVRGIGEFDKGKLNGAVENAKHAHQRRCEEVADHGTSIAWACTQAIDIVHMSRGRTRRPSDEATFRRHAETGAAQARDDVGVTPKHVPQQLG